MRLTAQEEYGLRCLLQLARHAGPAPVTVREIATWEGLSTAYVEKLLRILSRAGLTESSRGIRGGYRIRRQPEEITVGDVLRALGGFVTTEEICGKFTGNELSCVHLEDCGLRPVWTRISQQIEGLLDSVPLSSLLHHEDRVQILVGQPELRHENFKLDSY